MSVRSAPLEFAPIALVLDLSELPPDLRSRCVAEEFEQVVVLRVAELLVDLRELLFSLCLRIAESEQNI